MNIKVVGGGAIIGAITGGVRRALIIRSSDQFLSTRQKATQIARDSGIGGAVGAGLAAIGDALVTARTRLTKLYDKPPVRWDKGTFGEIRGLKVTRESEPAHSFIAFRDTLKGKKGLKYILQVTDKDTGITQKHRVYRWQLPKSLREFLKQQQNPVRR